MTDPNTNTWRWGFLGASRIGRGALAPAVHEAGQALHAVAARDLSRAEEYAREVGAARAYGSYAELLADPEVDAVYNALPNDAHLPLTLAALRAGKHVLCEKPLALNAAEVREMRAASEAANRFVLEAFSYRFHPQIARARELVRRGELGEVRFGRASFCFTLDRPDDYRWQAGQGGGALYDVGCYCVNALRLLLGREAVAASAVQRAGGAGVDADFAGLLDFGEGLGAHFDCSFTAVRDQQLSLIGTRGTLVLELPFSSAGQAVRLRFGEREESFAPMNPYRAMVEHFGRVARGEAAARFTLEDAEDQARTLDALFEAAREGRRVSV